MANNRVRVPWGLARRIIVRDGYCCRYCGHKLTLPYITFDHVVPLGEGGETNLNNLVVSCYTCNQKKGDAFLSPIFPPHLIYTQLIETFSHVPNIDW